MNAPARTNLARWAQLCVLTLAALGLLLGLGSIFFELYSQRGEPHRLAAAAALACSSAVAGLVLITSRRLRARTRDMERRLQAVERHLAARADEQPGLGQLRADYSWQIQSGAWLGALQVGERILRHFPEDALAREVADLRPVLTRRIQEEILSRRRPHVDAGPCVAGRTSAVELELPDEIAEPA
jgi:hypothetical protein